MAYKIYISDTLYQYSQNQRLSMRYIDLLKTRVDTRSGDEIAIDVINAAGLRFKE